MLIVTFRHGCSKVLYWVPFWVSLICKIHCSMNLQGRIQEFSIGGAQIFFYKKKSGSTLAAHSKALCLCIVRGYWKHLFKCAPDLLFAGPSTLGESLDLGALINENHWTRQIIVQSFLIVSLILCQFKVLSHPQI